MGAIDWYYVLDLILDADFWRASAMVVVLSVLTWSAGLVLGLGVALCKDSPVRVVRTGAEIYVWFFRSLPLLVLLIFVYNLPQLWPQAGPMLSNPFTSGLIALIISETAYIAEIHRGGLLGVPKGQHEAGHALGIRFLGRLRLIIVPQAFRIALPSLSNEFITIVKLTSLVSVISLNEILMVGQRLYTQNFKVIDTLIVVALFYVMIVSAFNALLSILERRLDVSRTNQSTVDSALPSQVTSLSKVERTPLSPHAPAVVSIDRVSKSFGAKHVLRDVSLQVREGEVVSIIGPSGSGKTTLIRTVNMLQDIDAGAIRLYGKDWIKAFEGKSWRAADFDRRITEIGMVFQSFNLFPHLSVLENVMLAPQYHKRGGRVKLKEKAMAALRRVEMQAHALKYPHQLSGGQQQRVAIARAIAMEPRIMLFDEPTSALDPELVNEVLRTIESLAADGMTMIIVTHEMRFARRISDRIVFMENGVIEADDSPEALFAAKENRVATFLLQSMH
ncbi:amino acid ABC transporter permease/ATP-binding protein [Microvirga sp. VF16]|uniref:amino acid ABC transporter permease/ATP-binding protein n=1 Tax=Microvirga sp. VF16 TaxID=2807101 RepID=UPI00193CE0E7|nr:amino acid ABC transporter permease/ATP-binding protein [Microvirga sp. VF16]QRM33147.1 amino acid ABC transporter permease/ATP-binding protein [Microvirga sp. VF16]